MDDDFELELQKTFFQEASINIEESEEVYLQFSDNTPIDLLARSFRLAHNLKGSAKAVGFSEIAEILHTLETLLLKLKKKEIEVNNSIINVLLMTNDKLKEIIEQYKNDLNYKPNHKKIIEEITKVLQESQKNSSNENLENKVTLEDNKETPQEEVVFFKKEKKEENKVNHDVKIQKNKIKKEMSEEIIRIPLNTKYV